MSDNDLVERVASAIFEAHNNDLVCWLDAKDWEREEYGELASAAIEAMLEPTEKMTWAAANTGLLLPSLSRNIWRVMVQAALEKDKARRDLSV